MLICLRNKENILPVLFHSSLEKYQKNPSHKNFTLIVPLLRFSELLRWINLFYKWILTEVLNKYWFFKLYYLDVNQIVTLEIRGFYDPWLN